MSKINIHSITWCKSVIAICFMISTHVSAWSQNGHRIVGKIAENHLTEQTKQAIKPLLSGDKLAEVTTWADEMRSNPEEFWRYESGKWHYINMSSKSEFKPHTYQPAANKKGVTDIYSGIITASAKLVDKNTSLEDKQFYFRFLTHLVGDLHQPMHVGRKEDRGGNRIDVEYFGRESNLHKVWDELLIEGKKLSYTEYVEFIDTNNQKVISEYLNSEPKDWVLESFEIAQNLYNVGDGKFKYAYVYEQTPVINKRLLQGGIRLAGLLNKLFDKSAKIQVNAIGKLENNKQ